MIPVIDLFAGPGGLGEGFSSYHDSQSGNPFQTVLSIEKDRHAHETLHLRSFFRQFSEDKVPKEYYRFLMGELTKDELFNCFPSQKEKADHEALSAELGVIQAAEVDRRIRTALQGNSTWILLGGPPCQAYSIAGRSRMSKVWRENPEVRDSDKRHFLYREYLRILAYHRPPVFVMENVRGILSSQVSNGRIFTKIMKDLRNPTRIFSRSGNGSVKYRLYSSANEPRDYNKFEGPVFNPEDFLIKTEKFGIPQRRHRVIILGVREDLTQEPEVLEKFEKRISIWSVIEDLSPIRSSFSRGEDSQDRWIKHLKDFPVDKMAAAGKIDSDVLEELKGQIAHIRPDLETGSEFVRKKRQHKNPYHSNWYIDDELNGFCNHIARGHMGSDIHRYFFASCFGLVKSTSPKLGDFPSMLLPNHKNVRDGLAKGHFNDRFRVQIATLPATTITSHIHKDGHYYIHPDPSQARSLTVREAARAQTFPDNYFFCGPRTQQYAQVGNAVPPLFALQLAGVVNKLINASNSS